MLIRTLFALAALMSTAACVPVFEGDNKINMTFDAVPPSQAPMNFADIMCCFDCTV